MPERRGLAHAHAVANVVNGDSPRFSTAANFFASSSVVITPRWIMVWVSEITQRS